MFSKEQRDFMRRLGVNVDFENLTEDDYAEIEEVVSSELQINGFDRAYNPTETGRLCESILDLLSAR